MGFSRFLGVILYFFCFFYPAAHSRGVALAATLLTPLCAHGGCKRGLHDSRGFQFRFQFYLHTHYFEKNVYEKKILQFEKYIGVRSAV